MAKFGDAPVRPFIGIAALTHHPARRSPVIASECKALKKVGS